MATPKVSVSITKPADFAEFDEAAGRYLLPPGFKVDPETGNVLNPDGSTRLTYDTRSVDKSTHAVVLTGPISTLVETSDGTVYDVSPHAVAVRHEHVAEVVKGIVKEHHRSGRLLDVPEPE